MKKVFDILVGDQQDYEQLENKEGYSIILAAKFPWHRDTLGYTKAPDKEHPEYLIAKRGDKLILNLIDPPDPKYISKEIIDAALEFIETTTKPVAIFCNKGESRSASICLLYCACKGLISQQSFEKAAEDFLSFYPNYKPGKGMEGFLQANWSNYMQEER